MKIANYSRIQLLMENLRRAKIAREKIELFLLKKNKDSDGSGPSHESTLYTFYVGEYVEEKYRFDLTGLCLGLDTVKFVQKALDAKIAEMEKEIETL